MKEGKFRTQINKCLEILYKLEMHLDNIDNPSFPKSPRSYFKGMSYQRIWEECLKNRFYNFQLFDNSLIFFTYEGSDSFSLSYYEFPYEAVSYHEFIADLDYSYQEVGESFREEYDEYLTTCNLKQSISPLRYDIDYKIYTIGRHPVSHIHIGYENSIRIRTEKIMGPIAFLCFILRQYYPDKWIDYINYCKITELERSIRTSLQDVPSEFIAELDQCEIYLR